MTTGDTSQPAPPDTTETLAGILYKTYCDAVGGVAFNGDPLPTWEEFKADASKQKQVAGWRAVAIEAATIC